MSVSVSIHPPEATTGIYLDQVTVTLNDAGSPPFAVMELSPHPARVYIAVRTVAEADALILAAVAAKDLLLAAQAPPPTCLTCGAATGLDPVHVKATIGTAARTEHYCHDVTACHNRRHPALPGMITALDGLTRQATP